MKDKGKVGAPYASPALLPMTRMPLRLCLLLLLLPAGLRAAPGVLAGQVVTTAPITVHAGHYVTTPGMPAAGAPGVPVAGAVVTLLGRHTVTDDAGRFRFDQVPPGTYTLTAAQSQFRDPTTLTVAAPGTVSVPLGIGYYLAIGVSRYHDTEIERLDSPLHDLQAVSDVLFRAFPGRTVLLADEQATKAQIHAVLRQLAAQMRPQDFFIFYYTGHGGSDLDDAKRWVDYLLPVDSDLDNYSNDIRDQELLAWLAQLPDPHRVTLILDSCYAGAFFTARKDGLLPRTERTADFQRLRTLGCAMLAGTDAAEESVDTEAGSVFTNTLLDGLTRKRKQADANHDRQITVQELFNFAAPRTASGAQYFGEVQHPQLAAGDNPVLLRY